MKEALVLGGPKVQIIDSSVPAPGLDQVVIKVVVSGSNPKDWKRADSNKEPINTGDDIAGTISAIGSNVTEFHVGDRVAAFHEMQAPNGSYAEYAVAWSHTTFHIPSQTSFEEASTIPLAAMTAALALYQNLALPLPWLPTTTITPLIIYGGSSAVGSFAIQLAVQSNIHPLICIAGKGTAHVESLIDKSKGDEVLDYRVGSAELSIALRGSVEKAGGKCAHAFDTICTNESYVTVSQTLDPKTGKIAVILPGKDYSGVAEGVNVEATFVGSVHGQEFVAEAREKKTGTKAGDQDFGYALFRLMGRGLQRGWFKGHPYEVVQGGLGGLEQALTDLKEGKVSATKLVFRIADTEGVEGK